MNEMKIISERRQFLREMERNLRLLESDLVLRREGYRFSFIIDFAAIYAFMHKTSIAEPLGGMTSSEDEARFFARRQVALKIVLSGKGRPVLLIPAYAAELRNHLNVISMQIRLTDMDLRNTYQDKLHRLVENSPEFRHFIETEISGTAEGDSRKAALDVGRVYFPEIYAVVACATAKGPQTLRTLLHSGALRDSEDELPGMNGFSYFTAQESVDRWYRDINKMRKKRAYQSFIDALACAYVENANERLNVKKWAVIFVSPSHQVKSVIADQIVIKASSQSPLSAIRGLDYFLLEHTHGDDIAKIRETLRIIAELLSIYDVSERQDSEFSGRGKELLLMSEPLWHRAENHLFLSDSALREELDVSESAGLVDETFLSLLRTMHSAAQQAGEELELEGQKLFGDLKDAVIALDKLIPLPQASLFGEFRIEKFGSGVRVTFPPLPDELPSVIEFFDTALSLLANRMVEMSQTKSSSAVTNFRREIFELASLPNADPEYCLCAAYILAMESRFDAALSMLQDGLNMDGTSAKKELMYLASVIHRKLLNGKKARSFIERALAIDPDDARYHLEYGKSLWLEGQFAVALAAYEPDVDALNEALRHVEVAKSRAERGSFGPLFLAQVENNLGFFYSERAIVTHAEADVILAEQHLAKLKALVPSERWIGRFYDTEGWILYARALICTGPNSPEREKILRDALQRLSEALDRGMVEGRRRLWQLHQARVSTALGEEGGL